MPAVVTVAMAIPTAAVGARRGTAAARRTLLVPCIAVSVGLVLLTATLLAGGLPEDASDASAFVGGAAVKVAAPARSRATAMQGYAEDAAAFTAASQRKKMRVTDQRSAEYQKEMDAERLRSTAAWSVFDSRGVNQVVGSADFDVGAKLAELQAKEAAAAKDKDQGAGFELPSIELPSIELPSFSLPAPAPAPAPAPQISAPAPASDGGNPFAFLAELFGQTTTTTTTTPPPSPLESFLSGLGLR